jgi:hypothetical protein
MGIGVHLAWLRWDTPMVDGRYVMLLALTRGVWALVLAVLSIFAALGLLAGAFQAAVADADEPPPRS